MIVDLISGAGSQRVECVLEYFFGGYSYSSAYSSTRLVLEYVRVLEYKV